jgi:hypothetical protein
MSLESVRRLFVIETEYLSNKIDLLKSILIEGFDIQDIDSVSRLLEDIQKIHLKFFKSCFETYGYVQNPFEKELNDYIKLNVEIKALNDLFHRRIKEFDEI